MAATYFISRKNKMMGRFNSHGKDQRITRKQHDLAGGHLQLVEKSDDLAAGYKDAHLGIAIKHQDGSVRLVRGGHA